MYEEEKDPKKKHDFKEDPKGEEPKKEEPAKEEPAKEEPNSENVDFKMPTKIQDYLKSPSDYPVFDKLFKSYNCENSEREQGYIFVIADETIATVVNKLLSSEGFYEEFVSNLNNNSDKILKNYSKVSGDGKENSYNFGRIPMQKKKKFKFF